MVQNVAVFFGGKSAEREISVLTGVLALRMIDPAKYHAVTVYIHCYATGYATCFLLHVFFVFLICRIYGILFDITLSALSAVCVVYSVICLRCRKRIPIKRL